MKESKLKMNKKIQIGTNKKTLDLIRKAVAYYLDDKDENGMQDADVKDYQELDKIYNILVDITFYNKIANIENILIDLTFDNE